MMTSLTLQHRGFDLVLRSGNTFVPVHLSRSFFEQFILFLTMLEMRYKITEFEYDQPCGDGSVLTFQHRGRDYTLVYQQKDNNDKIVLDVDWHEIVEKLRDAAKDMGIATSPYYSSSNTPYFASEVRPVWCGQINYGQYRVVFDHKNIILAKYHQVGHTAVYKRYLDSTSVRMTCIDGVWTSIKPGHSPDCTNFAHSTTALHENVPDMRLKDIQSWYALNNKPFPDNITSIDELKAVLMEEFPF